MCEKCEKLQVFRHLPKLDQVVVRMYYNETQ